MDLKITQEVRDLCNALYKMLMASTRNIDEKDRMPLILVTMDCFVAKIFAEFTASKPDAKTRILLDAHMRHIQMILEKEIL